MIDGNSINENKDSESILAIVIQINKKIKNYWNLYAWKLIYGVLAARKNAFPSVRTDILPTITSKTAQNCARFERGSS